MRIALVINTSWNIWNFRRGLIADLQSQGHSIIAIAPKDAYSNRLVDLGCTFVECSMDSKGTSPIRDAALFLRLRRLYKRHSVEVVLHFTIKPNIYGTLAAASLGIPCISNVSGLGTVFLHKRLSSTIAQWMYRAALHYPVQVFFQNETDRALFVAGNLVKQDRTGVLPGSGIALERFQFKPMPSATLPIRFLMLSRLLFDKGAHHFAEASAQLRAKGYVFEAILQGFTDFESKAGIPKHLLEKWHEEGTIIWLPPTDDSYTAIEQAHVVVLPSYREGTPRSLIEAAATGRPIIATAVPGCEEVVHDGRNGYLCKAADSKDLAEAMERMLLASQEILMQMGMRSRELAEAKFDEKQVLKAYRQAIQKIKSTH
jgi:glycosyltransferase involved in cell wall biosynthesis